eukprot:3362034-Prymnesium_polylepis.1
MTTIVRRCTDPTHPSNKAIAVWRDTRGYKRRLHNRRPGGSASRRYPKINTTEALIPNNVAPYGSRTLSHGVRSGSWRVTAYLSFGLLRAGIPLVAGYSNPTVSYRTSRELSARC